MIRNQHRVGDYLMVDDESGLVMYKSEAVRRWDGLWVRKDQYETRHPQEFVHAKADPRSLTVVRPDDVAATPNNNPSGYIGQTTLQTPDSPADHIFQSNVGIGDMVVSGSNTTTAFVVS